MIGASTYFPDRYFTPRYWPKLGATSAPLLESLIVLSAGTHARGALSGVAVRALIASPHPRSVVSARHERSLTGSTHPRTLES